MKWKPIPSVARDKIHCGVPSYLEIWNMRVKSSWNRLGYPKGRGRIVSLPLCHFFLRDYSLVLRSVSSRELTYPTLGEGKTFFKRALKTGDMLVCRRVFFFQLLVGDWDKDAFGHFIVPKWSQNPVKNQLLVIRTWKVYQGDRYPPKNECSLRNQWLEDVSSHWNIHLSGTFVNFQGSISFS